MATELLEILLQKRILQDRSISKQRSHEHGTCGVSTSEKGIIGKRGDRYNKKSIKEEESKW